MSHLVALLSDRHWQLLLERIANTSARRNRLCDLQFFDISGLHRERQPGVRLFQVTRNALRQRSNVDLFAVLNMAVIFGKGITSCLDSIDGRAWEFDGEELRAAESQTDAGCAFGDELATSDVTCFQAVNNGQIS